MPVISQMSSVVSRAGVLLCLLLLAVGLFLAYELQLAEANEHMGYRAFPVDLSYVILLTATVSFLGVLMPTAIRRPSDFFIFLYGLFVLLPYATLYPIRNPVETLDFIVFFAVLVGPFLAVRVVSVAVPPLRVPRIITPNVLVLLLVLLCICGVILALSNPTASAGFDLVSAYERRIQGRDIYSGTPMAYLNAAIVNGFAPFLAFFAGWQRRVGLLMLSLFCGLTFFYLLGLKAPLLYIVVALVIGYSARRGKVYTMVKTIYLLLLTAFIVFLFECLLFDYSFVGDYFIRRALSVPAWVSSAYFEFMTSGTVTPWHPLHGVELSKPITFLVGENFLGFPGMNANTNAFVYQLVGSGVPMYLATILLVACVFALLDAAYAYRRNPALIYVGFSYAILLTEQAATTALVSSGIGMLVILTVFSGAGEHVKASFLSRRWAAEA